MKLFCKIVMCFSNISAAVSTLSESVRCACILCRGKVVNVVTHKSKVLVGQH